jgi:hypothetical protein
MRSLRTVRHRGITSIVGRGLFLLATYTAPIGCGARTSLPIEESAIASGDGGLVSPKPPACTPGPPEVVLGLSDTANASVIAVDDDNVYFVAARGATNLLTAVPKRGGAATVIAQVDEIDAMAVDGDALYALSSTTGITRIDKSTGAKTAMVQSYATSLALDDASIYFTTFASVMRVSKTGGTPTVVIPGAQGKLVRDLSIVDGSLYWLSDASDVYGAAKDGTGARVLVHAGQIDDCMVAGTLAYGWERDLSGASLLSSPIVGGAQSVLVDGVETAAPVYAGGGVGGTDVIYWTGLAGHVNEPGAEQGLLKTVAATGITTAAWSGAPGFALVGDDACVYWIDASTNRVMRLAK